MSRPRSPSSSSTRPKSPSSSSVARPKSPPRTHEPKNPNTITAKAYLAQKLLLRATKTQAISDINTALEKWAILAGVISSKHPDYEPVLSSYAVALLLRWEACHEIKDIRRAIVTLESALVALGDGALGGGPSRNRYQNLSNLGAAYLDRYESFVARGNSGAKEGAVGGSKDTKDDAKVDLKDVLRAIECWEQAHSISIPLGLVRESSSKILPNLADAYSLAYSLALAGPEALERAIKYLRIALDYGDPMKRTVTRYKIGQCYSLLYSKLSIPADLQTAIDSLQMSLKGSEAEGAEGGGVNADGGLDREDRQSAMMELSRVLAKKYDSSRSRADLDAAIFWSRKVVEENQQEPWILRNLANLLYWQFKDLKDGAALDEAIGLYEVIWALYQSKPGRSMGTFYYSFGTALMRRWDGMEAGGKGASGGKGPGRGDVQDIERAVDLMQLAVNNSTSQTLDEYQHRLKAATLRRDRALGLTPSTSPMSTMRSSHTVVFPTGAGSMSSPNSPISVSFAEQQELPHRGGFKRAPIPSLSSRADPSMSTTSVNTTHSAHSFTGAGHRLSKSGEAHARMQENFNTSKFQEQRTSRSHDGHTTSYSRISSSEDHSYPSSSEQGHYSSENRKSETPSEDTIIGLSPIPGFTPITARRGQTAPSLLSESMSVMTVPAVNDLPFALGGGGGVFKTEEKARPRVLRRQTKPIPMAPPLTKNPSTTSTAKLAPIPEKGKTGFLGFGRLRTPKAA